MAVDVAKSYRNIAYRPGMRLYSFFSPTVSAVPVPAPWDISIGGRNYLADLSFEPYRREAYRHRSEPSQRESLNFDNIAGEAVINTSGLWRRDQDDWLFGAGELVLDSKRAADNRFYKSKGVNPWTQYQLSLLPDTTISYGLVNANAVNTNVLKTKCIAQYKYYMENDAVYWEDITKTMTAVVSSTAASGQPNISITALGNIANGMYATDITGLGAFPAGSKINSHSGSGPYTLVMSANLTASLPIGTVIKFVNGTDFPVPASAAKYYVDITANAYYIFVAAGTAGIYYMALGNTTGSLQYATSADINGGPQTTISAATLGAYVLTPANMGGIQAGMTVYDATNPAYISKNTVVLSVSATTVTLNAPITHNIANTDNIVFGFFGQVAQINTYGGYNTVFWGADNLWATAGPCILNWGGASQIQGAGNVPTWTNLMPVDVPGNWTWHAFAQGNSQIYLAGYTGTGANITDGAVYRLGEQVQQSVNGTVTTTATGYYAPVIALKLPHGEYPTGLYPYLNYILVGTNAGMRMCRTLSLYDPNATATGDLEGGPLIPNILQPVTKPVYSMCSNGRFLYFAWSNYDSGSTGIGRCDVTNFIDNLAPAYASDLMVNGQGDVYLEWDIATGGPLLTISGTTSVGVYNQTTTVVQSGTLETPWITFDVPDNKTLRWFHPQFNNNFGSVNCYILPNGVNSTFKFIGSQSTVSGTMGDEFPISSFMQSDKFRARIQLVRDATTTTQGPVLTRWTVRGLANVSSETLISAVIDLKQIVSPQDSDQRLDPYLEFITLENWRRAQTVIQFVEGSLTADVVIEQIDWLPESRQDRAMGNYFGFQGLAVVFMKTVGPYAYNPVAG